MKDAYRGHYQPACNELIPGADPYIAGLVARALEQFIPATGDEGSSHREVGHQLAPARIANHRNVVSERSQSPRRLHTGRSSLAAMNHGW